MVVVITGPESSGKSTLSELLAKEYNCTLVPEYARKHLRSKNYTFQDVEHIAKVQLKSIAKAKEEMKTEQMVISDTGNFVLEIWFEERFERLPQEWPESSRETMPDLYLLCAPDIPWEEDELRESPNDRHRLFELYLKKLEQAGLDFQIVQGDVETRVAQAKKSIDKKKATL